MKINYLSALIVGCLSIGSFGGEAIAQSYGAPLDNQVPPQDVTNVINRVSDLQRSGNFDPMNLNQQQSDQQTPDLNGSWGPPPSSSVQDEAAQGSSVAVMPPQNPQQLTQQAQQSPARPPLEDDGTAALLWSFDYKQHDRQSGIKNAKPNSLGVAHSSKDFEKIRLEEWTRHLKNIGVREDKINFEARRLSFKEFEMWASRFVWFEQSIHPNILDINK